MPINTKAKMPYLPKRIRKCVIGIIFCLRCSSFILLGRCFRSPKGKYIFTARRDGRKDNAKILEGTLRFYLAALALSMCYGNNLLLTVFLFHSTWPLFKVTQG